MSKAASKKRAQDAKAHTLALKKRLKSSKVSLNHASDDASGCSEEVWTSTESWRPRRRSLRKSASCRRRCRGPRSSRSSECNRWADTKCCSSSIPAVVTVFTSDANRTLEQLGLNSSCREVTAV